MSQGAVIQHGHGASYVVAPSVLVQGCRLKAMFMKHVSLSTLMCVTVRLYLLVSMCFVAPCGLQTVSGGSKVAVRAMYDAPEVTCGILTVDAFDLYEVDPLVRTICFELRPSLPNFLLACDASGPLYPGM